MVTYIVKQEEKGQNLEKYVRKVLKDAPLSFIYKLIRKKDIKVNGKREDKKYIVDEGDKIDIYITDKQLEDFKNKKEVTYSDEIKSWIVYEDNNVLIINKPRGILVQNDDSSSRSLSEMVLSYLAKNNEYIPGDAFTPGPAHRLDRNTSGLVVFGKNIRALQVLFDLFKDKELISKHYLTLVKGDIDEDDIVDASLYKDEKHNKVYVSDKGKKAITRYHVVKRFGEYTLLEVILITGRTHQIRVHMAYINHPVIGDNKYGDYTLNKEFENKFNFTNQFLHAYRLDFGKLPSPLEKLSSQHVESSLPKDMEDIIKKL